MINKSTLQNIISKYYLNGTVEAVKWDIKNKNLNIKFNSPNKELIGEITSQNFDLTDTSIGIFNTSQLLKLIGILNNELLITHTSNKLIIADNQFTVNYSSANVLTIPKAGVYNGLEDFNIEIDLDSEAISALIKAKNALPESNVLTLSPSLNEDGNFELAVIFGGNLEFSNKVTYNLPGRAKTFSNFLLEFDSDLFKEVLSVNKNSDKATLHIDTNGIIKLEFISKDIQSKYFVVSKEI